MRAVVDKRGDVFFGWFFLLNLSLSLWDSRRGMKFDWIHKKQTEEMLWKICDCTFQMHIEKLFARLKRVISVYLFNEIFFSPSVFPCVLVLLLFQLLLPFIRSCSEFMWEYLSIFPFIFFHHLWFAATSWERSSLFIIRSVRFGQSWKIGVVCLTRSTILIYYIFE